MLGVGEHIDWLDAGHVVLPGHQLQVAGLGGGVAADVDYLSGGDGEKLSDDFLVHAGTRGVGDDDVGGAVEGDEVIGEYVGHVAGEELGVVEVVEGGVDFGVVDGLLDIFDAYDAAAHRGNELSDGAGASVEVIDCVGGLEIGKLGHEGIEALGLGGVGLIERLGIDAEPQIGIASEGLHTLFEAGLAMEEVGGEVGVGVVHLGVYDVVEGVYLREGVAESGEEGHEVVGTVVGDDEDDHPLSVIVVAEDEVAEEAGVVADVVERKVVTVGIVADEETDAVGELVLKDAGLDVEHLVEEARDMEPEGACDWSVGIGLRVFDPGAGGEGVLKFVAVTEYAFGAADGAHAVAVDGAEALEHVAHLTLFGFELAGVVEHLPLASATDAEVRALDGDALGGILLYGYGFAFTIGFLAFQEFDVGHVARHDEGYEDDFAVEMCEGFAFGSDILDEEVFDDGLFLVFSAHNCIEIKKEAFVDKASISNTCRSELTAIPVQAANGSCALGRLLKIFPLRRQTQTISRRKQ